MVDFQCIMHIVIVLDMSLIPLTLELMRIEIWFRRWRTLLGSKKICGMPTRIRLNKKRSWMPYLLCNLWGRRRELQSFVPTVSEEYRMVRESGTLTFAARASD